MSTVYIKIVIGGKRKFALTRSPTHEVAPALTNDVDPVVAGRNVNVAIINNLHRTFETLIALGDTDLAVVNFQTGI